MFKTIKANPADPIAILVGAVIEVLAILHVPERLGLGADQVAQLGGALIMAAAAVRTMAAAQKRRKSETAG